MQRTFATYLVVCQCIQIMVLPTDVSYTGLQYAFLASGSFYSEQGLHDVSISPIPQVFHYNVTTALQVSLDVRYVNAKIGLYKDASNLNATPGFSALDPSSLMFPIDSIVIPASEFVAGMQSENQVMSVGALSGIYTNFNQFVTDYFGNRFGFETLFDLSGQSNYNNGVFDASALINIIHAQTMDVNTHEYIRDLSGAITLSQINKSLNDVTYSNRFGNRSGSTDASGNYLLSTTPYWQPQLDANGEIIYQDSSGHLFFVQPDGSRKDIQGNSVPEGESIFPLYYSGTPILDEGGKQVFQDASATYYYTQPDGSLKDASGQSLPSGVQTFPAYTSLVLLKDGSGNVVYRDAQNTYFYLMPDGRRADASGNVLGVSVQIFPVYEPGPGRPILDVYGNVIYQPVYDIGNGFLDGDLIFLNNGFQVTLKLDVVNNSIMLNQLGFANVASYQQQSNVNQQQTLYQGFQSISTVADDKKIISVINVPLLIRLSNLSSGPTAPPYPTTGSEIASQFR